MQNSLLSKFKSFIIGDFSNRDQVEDQKRINQWVHPLATHINRCIDSLIEGLPESNEQFFILEESDYHYPDGRAVIKPHIFRFALVDGAVTLTSYESPKEFELDQIRNSNPNFKLEYSKLNVSPTFGGMAYEHLESGAFYASASMDLGDGKIFTLTETISEDTLEVMELMCINGKSVTPYTTPIIYKRR